MKGLIIVGDLFEDVEFITPLDVWRRNKDEILQKRGEGLNNIDRKQNMRVSKENPEVQEIYDKYLDYPLSHKAHELLHTRYFVKRKK